MAPDTPNSKQGTPAKCEGCKDGRRKSKKCTPACIAKYVDVKNSCDEGRFFERIFDSNLVFSSSKRKLKDFQINGDVDAIKKSINAADSATKLDDKSWVSGQ